MNKFDIKLLKLAIKMPFYFLLDKIPKRVELFIGVWLLVIKDIFTKGRIRTTRENRKIRLTICKACPKIKEKHTVCTVCGCYMTIKTWLASAYCPENIWGHPPEENNVQQKTQGNNIKTR
jgi:ribosomal protein L32